jgi:PAS domain-containing protein
MPNKKTEKKLEKKITKLKKQLAKDNRCAAHFQSIFYAIPDATVFADSDRRIIMANPAVEKVFGYKKKFLATSRKR